MSISAADVALNLEKTARAIYAARGPQKMHPGQWAVLRFLANAPDTERDVRGVANYLGVTLGPASRAIAALERKGYIALREDEEDRRRRRIRVRKTGRELLENDPIKHVEGVADAMSEEEREVFAIVLTRLRHVLKETA